MDDLDCFLEALDNLPDDIVSAKFDGAPPRKPRSRKKKATSFDDTIDLHGMTADQALTALEYALNNRRGCGRTLLVITGRGNNSENGVAVLRDRVGLFLDKNCGRLVREYYQAPGRCGGDGAYIVICS